MRLFCKALVQKIIRIASWMGFGVFPVSISLKRASTSLRRSWWVLWHVCFVALLSLSTSVVLKGVFWGAILGCFGGKNGLTDMTLWTLAFWSCFRRFSACMTLSARFLCQKVSKSGVFVQKLPLPHSTTENATKMSYMQFCRVFCLKTPISTPKSLKTVLFAIYRVFVLFSSTSCIYRSDLAILAFYRKHHV